MQYHPRSPAACCKRASIDLGKHINVVGSIADDDWLAGGATTGVDTYDVFTGYGKQAKGVVISEGLFLGKGDLGQIFNRLNVARLYTQAVEHLTIVWNLFVNILYSIAKPLILQLSERLTRHRFDFPVEEHCCLPLPASV